MPSISSVWPWLQGLGTVLALLWAIKSYFVYHGWTLDEMMEDVASSPLPLNANGLSYWRTNVVLPYVDEGPVKKKAAIQLHTAITVPMALGLMIQFMKTIRRKAMPVHRWVGRATLTLALLSMPSFVLLINGFDHNQTAKYVESPILLGIPYFGIKGWREIRNKQIMDHRASMIMFASCFYYFGVARLVMIALNLIHSGPWAKYTGLGDWREWSEEDVDDCFGISLALAFPLTFGIATYRAYIGPTLGSKGKKE